MDEFNKKKYAWNTKVRAGRPWNDLDSAQEATRNAQAAFRDGRYKVTAVAFDYQANDSVPKDIEIIVDNFTQNVQTLVFYTPGQPIPIFGGDHYLGNDNPKLYAIPKIGNLNYIPNMTELPQSSFVKELRTDGVGSINPDLITMSQYPSTEFWFVVDYDDDRRYLAEQDGAALLKPYIPIEETEPPEAIDDEDASGSGGVSLDPRDNDENPDQVPLTIHEISLPAHGVVVQNPDGTITYTPTSGYLGTDTFTITYIDAIGRTTTSTITVTVINSEPEVVDDRDCIPEDTVLLLDVLANDTDLDGDALEVTMLFEPEHGTAEVQPDQKVRYVPNKDFFGTDIAVVLVSDGRGGSVFSTITFCVLPVNDLPVALPGVYTTTKNQIRTGQVFDHASDADGDLLTLELIDSPLVGALLLGADGTFTYTPPADWLGEATFTYTISDGPENAVLGRVTIYVNAPPVAHNDVYERTNSVYLLENVLANDTDENAGDTLTAVALTLPAHGELMFLPNGLFLFTPAAGWWGETSFVYELRDNRGGSSTATAFITLFNEALPISGETPTPQGNAGEVQRSRLTRITITFEMGIDASLLAGPGAISLIRTSALNPALLGTVVQTGALGGLGRIRFDETGRVSQITLYFDNADGSNISAGVEYGSLADGVWLLSIPSLGYHSTVGDANLRRLFGDVNNDGTVDGTDFAEFGSAFGTSAGDSSFLLAFDFDDNSTIDGSDFAEFGARFGLSL